MKRYNLIVVGGGLTGVAAAVAAAREGLEVLLIERTGSLGGAMSNSLVYPFMQYWDKDPANGKTRCLSAGIFTEMRRRQLEKAAGSPTDAFRSVSGGTDTSAGVSQDTACRDLEPERFQLEPEYFKLVLDDMVTEAGVDLLFHGTVCRVASEKRILKSVEIYTKSGIFRTGNVDMELFGQERRSFPDLHQLFLKTELRYVVLDARNCVLMYAPLKRHVWKCENKGEI